jgi:spermidine/putrescine transport system permease protein
MQVNVVGTVMFLVSVLIVVGGELNNRRRRRAVLDT